MTNEELIAKIQAEIESLYDNMLKRIKIDKDNSDYWAGKADAYRNVIDTITSLQQEQPEVDLEKEMEEYFGENWKDGTPIEVQDDMIKFARHFYELGLNARKEESK